MKIPRYSIIGSRMILFAVMSAILCGFLPSASQATVAFLDTAENKNNWVNNYPSGGGTGSFDRFTATGGEFQYTGSNSEDNLVAGTVSFFSANDMLEFSFDGFFAKTAYNLNTAIVDVGLATSAISTPVVKLGLKFTASGLNAKLVYNNVEYALLARPVVGDTTNGKAAFKIAYDKTVGGLVTVTQLSGTYLPADSSTMTPVPEGGVVLYSAIPTGTPIDFGTGLRVRIAARNKYNGGFPSPVTIDNVKVVVDGGAPSWPADAQRGVNVGNWLTSYEMSQTLAPWGTKLVRLQLLVSSSPFTPVQENGEWTFSAAGWTAIDKLLQAAKTNGLKVILDIHGVSQFFPNGQYSTWSQEPGASGIANKGKLVSLWKTIATRYKDERGTIAAYEILNEPNAGESPGVSTTKPNGQTPLDGADAWNTILTDVIAAIRQIDSYHSIVVEPVGYADRAYLSRLKYFDPETTPGIIYSVHLYSPHEYAEQGSIKVSPHWKFGFDGVTVNGTATGSGYYYPGLVDLITSYSPVSYTPTVIDKDYLKARVAPILAFQAAHKDARIFVGEFGAIRFAPSNLSGQDSTWTYLRDWLSLFYNEDATVTHQHWDWTIHAFRFSASDAYTGLEYDNVRGSTTRYADTNKIRLYKHYVNPANDTVAPPTYVPSLPDARIPATSPAAPWRLTASASTNGQIDLSWISVSRAASYRVQRATTTGSPYDEIGTVSATPTDYTLSFSDTGVVGNTTYFYIVTAHNDHGDTNSAEVSATALAAPGFSMQPQPQTVTVGDSATLAISLTGHPTPSVRWFKDGTAIPGATGTVLTLPILTTANAGNYMAVATNSLGSATSAPASLTVAKAPATVSLAALSQTYDGTPRSVTATTTPAGLTVAVTYDGSATAPTNAGSYAVTAVVSDPNYTGSASGTLIVAKAPATVALSALSQTYNGTPRSVTATTSPAGLNVVLTYAGSATAPTNAGSYAVTAVVSDPNYTGSASGTLIVAKAPATISLAPLSQIYDGAPRVVTATTSPADLTVTVTYDGQETAPTNPGSYAIAATVIDPNYTGSTSATLVVTITALVRHAPSLSGGLDGSLQMITGENLSLNGNAWVSGDLLVPGLPTVRLNGNPIYGGTLDGTGSVSPSDYQVTLNGNALLGRLVRRTDPLALPVVSAPPMPAGTRDVSIQSAGQNIGDPATLRHLTLNGNAGNYAVPPGTYGNFTANSQQSGFIFGVAGATTPAVYYLQDLKLNNNSRLQIVGPVVLVLAQGVSVSGNAAVTGNPEWLTLAIAAGGLTLNGNAVFQGSVVAPSGAVTINGNAALTGSVVSDRLTINGNSLLQPPQP